MRIALLDFVLDPRCPGSSGLSDIVWGMATHLAQEGHEAHVIGPYPAPPSIPPGITVHSFSLPPLGYRNIVGHCLIVLKLRLIVQRLHGLAAIHAPEYLSTGVIAPSTRVPVTLTTPGNIYERIAHGNPYDWSTTLVYKAAARSSARWCRLIHAISTDQARWWRAIGASEARMSTFPLGVNFDLFHRRPDARAVLGLPGTDPVVLYVGRLSREKNIRLLLDAMARLAVQKRNIRLHLVGTGPDRASLERMARDRSIADLVQFEGPVPLDLVPYWYSACNVCVLPSTSEPLGRVMLEAMACGTVFVGAAVGGIVDHVRHGINGYLFAPGDTDQLSEILDRSLQDDEAANRIRTEAARYARENFDWRTVVQRYRAALETAPR